MRSSKRERLAAVLQRFAILPLLERLVRRPGLLVVNYHRIGDAAGQPLDEDVFSATAEQFRGEVAVLRDHFHLLDLDGLAQYGPNGRPFDRPCAMITFDDGYQDNYTIALPILQELGAPAVFFIPTQAVDDREVPWWDHIAYIVKTTPRETFRLDYPQPFEVDRSRTGSSGAVRRLLDLFKQAPGLDVRRFLGHLEERAGVSPNVSALGQSLLMTWEHVRTLAEQGMDVESHTHTHRLLCNISERERRDELGRSKTILERITGRPVRAIAYPVGSRMAFTDRTKQLAREVGYRFGFSFYGGVNRSLNFDPWNILRVSPTYGAPLPLFRVSAWSYSALGRSFDG